MEVGLIGRNEEFANAYFRFPRRLLVKVEKYKSSRRVHRISI